MIEESEKIVNMGLDRVLPVPDITHSVTADVIRDCPEAFCRDGIGLAAPHLEAERKTVHEDNRRDRRISGEKVVEVDPIEKCAHGSGPECDEVCRGGGGYCGFRQPAEYPAGQELPL
jgi:hypothetical protein